MTDNRCSLCWDCVKRKTCLDGVTARTIFPEDIYTPLVDCKDYKKDPNWAKNDRSVSRMK